MFEVGRRKKDDGLLQRVQQKGGNTATPTNYQVTFNIDLGTKFYTFINFTSPSLPAGITWTPTVNEPTNFNKVSIIFEVQNQLELTIDARVYGYNVSPGVVYQ